MARLWMLAVWLWLAGACDAQRDPARALERRILAPCCYRQPLEDHDSPIAHGLRDEIEHRVARGEPPAQIEQDLVARYGPAVLAAPPSRWAVVGFVVAAIGAGLLLLRGLVHRRARPVPSPGTHQDDRYSEQLADELAALD